MSSNAPATLTNRLSVAQTDDVSRWWLGLPPAERRGVRRLLDQEAARSPVRLVGRFVDARQRYEGVEEASVTDFYEYLVNHELTLDDGRTYHICFAHREARRALAAGEIRASFRCPLARTDCPMRAVLDRAPGRDLCLEEVR